VNSYASLAEFDRILLWCTLPGLTAVEEDINRIKNEFLYPKSRFYGKFTPEQLAFNANLQEFAQRVSIICGLETGGQVASEEAYQQIKRLWKQLKRSKQELLDKPKPESPELPDGES
jgi:sigma54-dependent transcription regulator